MTDDFTIDFIEMGRLHFLPSLHFYLPGPSRRRVTRTDMLRFLQISKGARRGTSVSNEEEKNLSPKRLQFYAPWKLEIHDRGKRPGRVHL